MTLTDNRATVNRRTVRRLTLLTATAALIVIGSATPAAVKAAPALTHGTKQSHAKPPAQSAAGKASAQASVIPSYKVTDFGPLDQIASDVVAGLNGKGDITVWQPTGSGSYAPALFSGASKRTLPIPKGYLNGFANAVNIHGDAVGWTNTTQNPVDTLSTTHACLFTAHGKAIDMGTLGGRDSKAYSINDSGLVVGSAWLPNKVQRAFRWANGKMSTLSPLPLGSFSIAFDINQAGVAVGGSDIKQPGNPIAVVHAVVWHNAKPIDLGTLKPGGNSMAYGVNDFNDVVGVADTTDNTDGQSVFLYTNGKLRDLNVDGRAFSINDKRQIVGTREGPERGHSIAFLWNDGKEYDIADLVPAWKPGFEVGYRINDAGDIVCASRVHGQIHAVLLTPVRK